MNGPQTPAVRSEEHPFPPLTTIWYPIWTQIGKISFLESHNGGTHEHPPNPLQIPILTKLGMERAAPP